MEAALHQCRAQRRQERVTKPPGRKPGECAFPSGCFGRRTWPQDHPHGASFLIFILEPHAESTRFMWLNKQETSQSLRTRKATKEKPAHLRGERDVGSLEQQVNGTK